MVEVQRSVRDAARVTVTVQRVQGKLVIGGPESPRFYSLNHQYARPTARFHSLNHHYAEPSARFYSLNHHYAEPTEG